MAVHHTIHKNTPLAILQDLLKQLQPGPAPGPPPRSGLEWKPTTHRWIRPEDAEEPEEEQIGETDRNRAINRIKDHLVTLIQEEKQLNYDIQGLNDAISFYQGEINKELIKDEDDINYDLIAENRERIDEYEEEEEKNGKVLELLQRRKNKFIEDLQEARGSHASPSSLPPSANEKQKQLTSSRIHKSESLVGGMNVSQVYFVDLEDGTRGVYKPSMGEPDLGFDDDITGDLYLREVAAYELAKILGGQFQNLVPPTSIREAQGDIGSIQEFIEDAFPISIRSLNSKFSLETLQDCALMDALMGNQDRHQGNALEKEGRVFLLYHGYTFPNGVEPRYKKSIFISKLEDKEEIYLSEEHQGVLSNMIENKRDIAAQLRPYLGKREIAAMFVRAETMLESDTYSMGMDWE